MTRTRRLSLSAVVLVGALAFSACGSSDDEARSAEAEAMIDPTVQIEITQADNGKTLEMGVGQIGVITDAPSGEEVKLSPSSGGVVGIGIDDQGRPSIVADATGTTKITVRCCPEPANPGWVWEDVMTFTVNVS